MDNLCDDQYLYLLGYRGLLICERGGVFWMDWPKQLQRMLDPEDERAKCANGTYN
jgi:hypothetical protein